MKKLILLGAVLVVALMGWYAFFPQTVSDNSAKKFVSQEELNAFVKENSQAGYGGAVSGEVMRASTQESAAKSADVTAQTTSPDYSQTNIQVAGVDEADIVKTDGKYIYSVSGSKVIILDAYPAENATIVSQIGTNGTVNEIFVNKDRLVVFGQESYQYPILATKSATGAPAASGAISEKMIASESIMRPYYYSPRTFINVYDVSDKANPKLARNISIDGNYYDSRMIGDYVYAIANQPVYNYGGGPVPLPVIYSGGVAKEILATDIYYFGMPDSSFIFTNIVSLNTQTGAEPSSKTFLMGYSQSIYVSQDNIYIVYQKRVSESKYYDRIIDEVILPLVPADVQGRITEIRNYNISESNKMEEIGKIFDNYISSLNPEQAAIVMKSAEEKAAILQKDIAKEMDKTVIHKISIDNGNIEYKTNGEVPGQPLNQFSMDESNGYFRIATTTSGNRGFFGGGFGAVTTGTAVRSISEQTAAGSAETASQVSGKMAQAPSSGIIEAEQKKMQTETVTVPVKQAAPQVSEPLNHLYVLDGDLKIVGKLEDLASGERIYSVRFLGDKAYMVTFRQTDPLFVIDLSSPQSPKVLGYLKVPGVSDYLHPYDETHIIGVGRDASEQGRITGMKLSLFDVSNVSSPTEVSKYIIGDRGASSEALNDHKAFLFSKEKNLLVIPVSEYDRMPATGVPEWQWESKYWQGAYVFNLDLENGFSLKGKITHQNNTDNNTYSYDWNSQIRRSLFIDNTLYTVSNSMVKMNSLADLAEINKIELPVQTEYTYAVY